MVGAKWGITVRLTGGPLAVTRVAPGGEGAAAGVQVGDVIMAAAGYAADVDREAAVAAVRGGGKVELLLARPAASALEQALRGGEAAQLPSLLAAARERGFTEDGEIFSVAHLAVLGCEVCGLDCQVASFGPVPPPHAFRSAPPPIAHATGRVGCPGAAALGGRRRPVGAAVRQPRRVEAAGGATGARGALRCDQGCVRPRARHRRSAALDRRAGAPMPTPRRAAPSSHPPAGRFQSWSSKIRMWCLGYSTALPRGCRWPRSRSSGPRTHS